ncbi:AAWKG family protein [Streptomyces sp. NPDC055189]
MAEDTGIDENHDDHLKYVADAKYLESDTWADLVAHITGYPMPKRPELFDKLRSDKGGKLFRMDFQEKSIKTAVEDSTGFAMNSDDDYDIWFFDKGKTMEVKQARIVFEGRVKSGDEVIFASAGSDNVNDADVRSGNEFTDYNDDKMDSRPLARYMNGPRAALMALLEGSTEGTKFSELPVPGGDAVVLQSFDDTGKSFDYAAKFFRDQAPLLKEWEDRFGADDASWKGEAADVFRSLIEKIRENYDNYVETFNSAVGDGSETSTEGTVYSRALALGRTYLEDAARDLLAAWLKWANSPHYDPHQVLRYVLDDLATWVNENNVKKTDIEAIGPYYTTYMHSPHGDFSQVSDYGDLTDSASWTKVGDKAVEIWTQGVDKYLGEEAAIVQSRLNNHFIDLSKDFTENIPKPKTTSTASEDYADKKAEDAQAAADKAAAEAAAAAKKAADDAAKARAEDKAAADKLRDEANDQRAEDKAYAEKLRDEANKQRAEDKAEAAKARAEAKAEAAKARAEAEAAAKANSKALGDSLGGLNNPAGGGGNQKLNLDDLLNPGNQDNPNKPPTESLGNLGDLNNPGGNSGGLNGLGGDGNQKVASVPPIPQNLGNFGDLNNPGGSTGGLNGLGGDGNQQPAAMPPGPQNLGNLGNINGGANTSLKTPTGGNTRLSDDKVTTGFPDGSKTSFDPDSGTLTTTNPDGSTTTQNLGDGTKVTNPDGSVTSLGDDGKLTTTFPDGTVQSVDPSTGQGLTTNPDGSTTNTNLGSLGDINGLGGADSVLNSPTGADTRLTGGDLATDFPDGSKTSFDPDSGTLTTTNPDGSTTTQNLGDGTKVTNPDGSVTSLGDDGKLTTTFPDGTRQSVDLSTGQAVTTDPNGHTTTQNLGNLGNLNGGNGGNGVGDLGNLGDLGDLNSRPDTQSISDLGNFGDINGGQSGLESPTGAHTSLDHGDFATTFADGSKASFDPDSGMLTSTNPDGSTTLTDLTHGAKVTNPDGSVTTLDNGMLTSTNPDGSKQVIDPDTGIATVTDPQGHTKTVDLHDLNSAGNKNTLDIPDGLNSPGGGGSNRDITLPDLNGGGSGAGSGGGGAASVGAGAGLGGSGSLDGLGAGGAAPLSDGTSANGPAASGGGAGTPGAPGTPGSPGMPMGGGMGGMGGGGEKGNGERVRAVLVDAVEESERRNRRRRSPWNRQEDSDTFLAPASRVTTTGGDNSEEVADSGRRSTTSADYLEEDADVWGTEEGGTPAVIGR